MVTSTATAPNDDRAFIFNPRTRARIRRSRRHAYAAHVRARGADCLQSQLGQVAGRKQLLRAVDGIAQLAGQHPAGRGGARPAPHDPVQLINTLAGLDLLFHGPNHLEGWGQPFAPDRTLLTVTGFNSATDEYNYAVNTHFGRQSALQAYGQPFVFVHWWAAQRGSGGCDAAAARALRWWPGRWRRWRWRWHPGGRGGPGGGCGAADAGQSQKTLPTRSSIGSRRVCRIRSTQIIALKDTLVLSPDQLAKLQASSDSFNTRVDSLATSARTQLKKLGANLDATTMFGIMRREFGQVRDIMRNALNEAQQELTPGQWALLPESIRSPTNPRGRNGQNGANGANSRRPPP